MRNLHLKSKKTMTEFGQKLLDDKNIPSEKQQAAVRMPSKHRVLIKRCASEKASKSLRLSV